MAKTSKQIALKEKHKLRTQAIMTCINDKEYAMISNYGNYRIENITANNMKSVIHRDKINVTAQYHV